MGSHIGDLFANLKLETSSFTREMTAAQTRATAFGAFIGTALGNVAVDIGRKFESLALNAIQFADSMNLASQRTGVSVESLSALKYAAEQSGLGFEELQTAMGKLAKGMVSSGKPLKDVDQALLDLADKFRQMPDGTTKTALALETFGKAGAALIPFLNEGRAGISGLMEEAQRLGVTIDTKTARAADEFNDNLDRMKAVAEGVGNTIIKSLLPTLTNVSSKFVDAARESGGFQEVGKALDFTLKQVAASAIFVSGMFGNLGKTITATAAAAINIARGDFAAARESMATNADETARAWQKVVHAINEIHVEASSKFPATGKHIDKGLTEPAKRAAKAFQEIGQVFQIPASKDKPTLFTAGERMEQIRAQIEQATGPARALEFQRPLSDFGMGLDALAPKLSSITIQSQALSKTWLGVGQIMGSAFEDAVLQARGFSEVLKGLAQDMARLVLRNLVTAPLSGIVTKALAGLFGGGREHGGPVSPHHAYLVGEGGAPELFVPGTRGSILPLEGAGGLVIHNHIDARGADGGVEHRIRRALAATHESAVRNSLMTVRDRQLRTP